MAGIIAGSVAGWSPIERPHDDDDLGAYSRPRAKSDLDARTEAPIPPTTAPDETPFTTDSSTTRVDENVPADTPASNTQLDPPKS